MKVPFTLGTVGHFGLAVRNPKRSAEWFERTLGLSPQFEFEDGVAVGNDNVTIALFKGTPSPETLGHMSFHLPSMAKLQKALEHLKQAGVEVEDPGAEIGPESPGSANSDLESAVAYYAIPENADTLFPSRFDPLDLVTGPEIQKAIPAIWKDETADDLCGLMLKELLKHFRVFAMDLTTPDIANAGIRVVRMYSPDLMALPLPSFPEAEHPRFAAYGGFRSEEPHPYP